jgi:signal transduction histidine kinase/CheY-like chemotaxis protein
MNTHKNKSLASQLTHRIFATYLVLATFWTLLQIYFIYANHEFVAEHGIFNIQIMLITLVLNAAGLWAILVFFINRKQRTMQQEAAEEINHAKSRFLSAASHDLRQPMHALNLYLASLSELEMSKPVHACVDNLNKCAKAMNDMLDTLLDISNIDSGATQARFSIFPIASPIDRIYAEFEPLAKAKGVALHFARCSAFVNTDEELVERMLRLLVSNAVRYTEHGKILIGCRRVGEQLRVAVIDTGLGIALDKQQAIFEEHFQLNNYERNRAKGLGLGLTIVQRLAKLLGTSITLNSTPGVGSLFAFDLPRVALDAIQPITSTLMMNLSQQKNITVLVVDDEPLIRDATLTLLECWGYTVINAANGRDALEQLTQNACTPDVIMSDYLLEGDETGVDVITMLRDAFQKEIPALLVTGITLPEHIATMRQSGLTYMYKPLDHEKLQTMLSQLIKLNYVQ